MSEPKTYTEAELKAILGTEVSSALEQYEAKKNAEAEEARIAEEKKAEADKLEAERQERLKTVEQGTKSELEELRAMVKQQNEQIQGLISARTSEKEAAQTRAENEYKSKLSKLKDSDREFLESQSALPLESRQALLTRFMPAKTTATGRETAQFKHKGLDTEGNEQGGKEADALPDKPLTPLQLEKAIARDFEVLAKQNE